MVCKTPNPNIKCFSSVQTRRLHESFEGSYSSLASSGGEISRVIVSRQWETHAFSNISEFGGKLFLLGHNVGSKHAGRSRKVSIDAGDHLVSEKSLSQNFGPLDWRPGPVKLVKKHKTPPLCEPLPGEPLTQIKKIRGSEQLSSYNGWRVITKNPRANLLARAVVKGWFYFGFSV